MDRDTSQFSPNPGGTILSYVEVTSWETKADRCIFHARGGVTSDFGWGGGPTITSKMQYWTGSWHDYDTDDFPDAEGSDRFYGNGDLKLCEVDDYFARQAVDRLVSVGCYSSGAPNGISSSARAWIDYTVPHLAPSVTWATTNPVVRNSDNSITLTWNAPALEYSAMCIEVQTDNSGTWSQEIVLWNTATTTTWTGCSAGHSYQFRIRTNYLSSYSAYDTCATIIYNTPLPPTSISTAAVSGTTVEVTLVNPSQVATSVEYQVSTDGGSTWGASSTSANITTFQTSVSGTGKIRVRNVNSTGSSAWLVSDTITTITPPAAPTLTAPAGTIIDLASGSVDFEWTFNSLDGSAQTAYEFSLSKNGGAATTSSGTTAKKVTQSLSSFSAGDTITVKVRTKGADSNWGAWSATKTYNVYSAPTVSITSPSATVTGMPISLSATYSDMAGFTCQYAHVSLTQGGRTLFDEDAEINGTSITASLDMGEFLPANGGSYTIVLDVRSSSGLQASANATFTTAFTEPQAGDLQITNDPDTGYASLLATFDAPETVSYSGNTNTQYASTEGYVRSLAVEGKSEKWNQIALAINSTNWTAYNNNYATVAFADDVATMTVVNNQGNTYALQTRYKNYAANVLDGHYYYMTAETNPSVNVANYCIRITVPHGTDAVVSLGQGATANTWTRIDGIIQSGGTGQEGGKFGFVVNDGNVANSSTIQFRNPVAIDLTAIFGSGNEPATVESFKATDVYKAKLAAGELYDYDAGSLVSIEGVSVGDGTITATLRSAGSVHDQLQADKDSYTVERNVTVHTFDGSESWQTATTDGGLKAWWLSTSQGYGPTVFKNRERYAGGYTTNTGAWKAFADKTIGSSDGSNLTSTAGLLIVDNDYADVTAWKNHLVSNPLEIIWAAPSPTTDTETSMSTIEIGSAFTVGTELDSTFEMTTWDGSADAVSISVARVNADGLAPLIEDAASGAGAVDKYAPLNTPYQYAVTTKSSANAVKTVYVDNEIITDLWFAYWTHKDGDTVTEMTASAKWSPDNGGIQLSRPQKTRVYYAGRKDPVSYDGSAVALSETPSWMLVDRSEVQPFVQLVEDGGRGVYKSCDGWVYHADFDLTLSPKYTAIGYYGGIMLSVTRIAGDQL